jgi:A/G-specific adenine glycosylase
MPTPTLAGFNKFKKAIWKHYAKHRRSFPWRERPKKMTDAAWVYRVVISEIMLQQTQAPRVVEKFNSFMKKFPDFPALARAPLQKVLAEWQGLGYNRRGLYLKKMAEIIVGKYAGKIPRTKTELVDLPGIGPHTAGSILAFAFNIAEPFIETNIRTVYIHFFFKKTQGTKTEDRIDDKKIHALVAQTIDQTNPREWFFALMDYGVYLKRTARLTQEQDPAKRSKHYKKQSAFRGSNRELRAALLRKILEKPTTTANLLKNESLVKNDEKLVIFDAADRKNTGNLTKTILKNLAALEREGFIKKKNGTYSIMV